jgi:hypothetical protein
MIPVENRPFHQLRIATTPRRTSTHGMPASALVFIADWIKSRSAAKYDISFGHLQTIAPG